MREWVGIFLRGFFMGAADAVPGVSGGTIALITGIYERLMTAITAADPRVLRAFLNPRDADERERVLRMLVAMDVKFLAVLGLGIVTALVSAAHVVTAAIQNHPGPTFAFFFGLIAASAVVLYREVPALSARTVVVAVVGFLLAFVLTGLPAGRLPHTPLVVFLSGFVAISAMVLPGVSGSLLLLVLGQYTYLMGTLQSFVGGLAGLLGGGPVAAVVAPGTTVVLFVAGAGLGLLGIAHVVSRALARYRVPTLVFLVSLMVGALRKPVIEVRGAAASWSASYVALVAVAVLVGGAVVFAIDHYTGAMEY